MITIIRVGKQLFNQEWNIKPHRGRQRKVWGRMVDDLFIGASALALQFGLNPDSIRIDRVRTTHAKNCNPD